MPPASSQTSDNPSPSLSSPPAEQPAAANEQAPAVDVFPRGARHLAVSNGGVQTLVRQALWRQLSSPLSRLIVQEPQWAESLERSDSHPFVGLVSQSPNPVLHDATAHAPPTH